MEQQRNADSKQQQLDDVDSDTLFDYSELLVSDDNYDDDDGEKPFIANYESDTEQKIVVEEWETIMPEIDHHQIPKKLISTAEHRPSKPSATKKKNKTKSDESPNKIDKYVNHLLDEDITASLKSLEKKYKKEQLNDGGLCEQCGLSFTNANDYKKHIRSHDKKGICLI